MGKGALLLCCCVRFISPSLWAYIRRLMYIFPSDPSEIREKGAFCQAQTKINWWNNVAASWRELFYVWLGRRREKMYVSEFNDCPSFLPEVVCLESVFPGWLKGYIKRFYSWLLHTGSWVGPITLTEMRIFFFQYLDIGVGWEIFLLFLDKLPAAW